MSETERAKRELLQRFASFISESGAAAAQSARGSESDANGVEVIARHEGRFPLFSPSTFRDILFKSDNVPIWVAGLTYYCVLLL